MRLRMQPRFVTVDKMAGILQNTSGNRRITSGGSWFAGKHKIPI